MIAHSLSIEPQKRSGNFLNVNGALKLENKFDFSSHSIEATNSDVETPIKLSEELWNLDWGQLLPFELSSPNSELTFTVRQGSIETIDAFAKQHYGSVFSSADGTDFLCEPNSEAKKTYMERVCDFFDVQHEGKTVAILMTNPIDWSTYYVRSGGVLPDYRGNKLVTRIIRAVGDFLAGHGVRRIVTDISVANHVTTKTMMNEGFRVSGGSLSERWGAMTQLTRWLDDEAKSKFYKHYCAAFDSLNP